MSRIAEDYTYKKRGNTYQFSLNPSCELPHRVCAEWQRRSIKKLPDELSLYRNSKSKTEIIASIKVLISYLKKKQEEEGSARHVQTEDITVGEWLAKFTEMETSPRTGINAAENKPYSVTTLRGELYGRAIKTDWVRFRRRCCRRGAICPGEMAC